MTSHGQIEWTQSITGERVGTALEYDITWLVPVDNALDDRLENALVAFVGDSVPQWHIDCVSIVSGAIIVGLPLARADTVISDFACSGEELPVFVETGRHDSICGIERFFDTVSMMNIDIDIQHSLVISGHKKSRAFVLWAHLNSSRIPRTISYISS